MVESKGHYIKYEITDKALGDCAPYPRYGGKILLNFFQTLFELLKEKFTQYDFYDEWCYAGNIRVAKKGRKKKYHMEIIEEVAKENAERILEEFSVFLKYYPREFVTEGYFEGIEFFKKGTRYDSLSKGKNQTKLYDRI